MGRDTHIGNLIYKLVLQTTGVEHKLWKRLRARLIQLRMDPDCILPIHGRLLRLPLSHNLPLYQTLFPLYDQLPSRLGRFIRQHKGVLTCIDVGANIGDTVAAFYGHATDTFLAIEPNPRYRAYLQANWGWCERVRIEDVLCTTEQGQAPFALEEHDGTAVFVPTEKGATYATTSLDMLLQKHQPFSAANVLKIDTDGFDFDVISGASQYISTHRPAILFESAIGTRKTYTEDCLHTLRLLAHRGYTSFLLYDNFGYLMGRFQVQKFHVFSNLLFYQLTSPFGYFDILAMQDEDMALFHQSEVQFFVERMSEADLRPTATAAGMYTQRT